MSWRKRQREVESRSKKANDLTFYQSDDSQRFFSSFSNRSIAIERGLGNDRCAFKIDGIFEQIGWSTLFYIKKSTYSKFIKIFFANMRIVATHFIIKYKKI
jgi:hypothetical protein